MDIRILFDTLKEAIIKIKLHRRVTKINTKYFRTKRNKKAD